VAHPFLLHVEQHRRVEHAGDLGWSRADLERWYTDCLSALLLG
jgi:hypothetical protein